ncbi:S9 family peptidase [Bowmanella dokdonensis]|uniref:S9 family peptidase n=1 Tax=Bowmanella dokdonensis TaxID=751969 RepID=A0A939IP64_9ALTE|nr:S9 family peptidase [Bowmanella dokdonensis]MBN7825570.1 S9 family peptidase [Bowmanella dokdonensis]
MKTTCCLALLLMSLSAMAIEPQTLTLERIFSSPSLEGGTPVKLKISPDASRVTFLKGKESDYERYDLWEYHIASGKTRRLLDSDTLHQGQEQLSDEEKARRERLRLHGSGIVDYQWSDDGKALLFPLAGDAYYFRLGESQPRRLLNTQEFETDLRFSPKGNKISFIRNQNLHVMDIATGQETAITTDGQGPIKYGMAEFVAQEEMGRMTGYWWAPDESRIAYTRIDETPVEEVTRSEIYADKIDTITQRYPRAGTANVKVQLAVTTLDDLQTRWIDLGSEQDMYLPRVKWMRDSLHLAYQWQSRDQKGLELRKVNVQSGESLLLLSETSPTWVNLHEDLHFLKQSPHFIWASERDGFKHLYLFHNSGKLVRQLTRGDWVMDNLSAVSETARQIYFTGRRDSPLEKHLYRVSLDGGEPQRITTRPGFHSISFDQQAKLFVDSYSNVNQPPQISLHKPDGEQLAWLAENIIDEQHPLAPYQHQWVKPTFGHFTTEEGIRLYYRLYTPQKLSGRHPAIVYLYGGPHAQVVQDSWAGPRGLVMQYWVSQGYVVFSIDNRGSNFRGKAFEEPIYRNMGEVEVRDQVAGVQFLSQLPYVDSKRLGIYGHSYGGYMALMSMFKSPDTFAAGVAGAPVTDWLLYDTHYTERYMDHPANNAKGYQASSVFPHAGNLRGDLLIYHGMADDNVLFTHSTRLYKALQDLALPFEMMDYPGKKHGIRGKQTSIHLYRTITGFFDRHLGKPSQQEVFPISD